MSFRFAEKNQNKEGSHLAVTYMFGTYIPFYLISDLFCCTDLKIVFLGVLLNFSV